MYVIISSFFYYFVFSFHDYLLNTYCVPGIVEGITNNNNEQNTALAFK